MRLIVLLMIASIILTGCVERRINITSDPPQATVVLDGKQVGKTPIQIPFDFYGTREITLIKNNYHTLSNKESIEAPIYQTFPLDFFVELMVPFTIYDNHNFYYTLKPYLSPTDLQKKLLLDRANRLRQEVATPPTEPKK